MSSRTCDTSAALPTSPRSSSSRGASKRAKQKQPSKSAAGSLDTTITTVLPPMPSSIAVADDEQSTTAAGLNVEVTLTADGTNGVSVHDESLSVENAPVSGELDDSSSGSSGDLPPTGSSDPVTGLTLFRVRCRFISRTPYTVSPSLHPSVLEPELADPNSEAARQAADRKSTRLNSSH